MTAPFRELVALAAARDPAFRTIPKQDCIAAARAFHREQWNNIRHAHDQGASGSDVLLRLTEAADEILTGIVQFGLAHAAHPQTVLARGAICALGGYGRRELSPCSDLDVCLLYDTHLDNDLAALNDYLVPFLYDVGFKTGWAIRNVDETAALAKNDAEVLTAYLQARCLLGDTTTFGRLKMRLMEGPHQYSDAIFKYIRQREHPDQLHEGYRDLHNPEPNLKENVGGLRDYHAATWLLWLHFGPLSLDDLARLGHITPEEHLELLAALDFIWRLRNELHFHTGKPQNQLTYPLQRHVAAAFHYGGDPTRAMARLMEDYYRAARKLRLFLRSAIRICDHQAEIEFQEAEEGRQDLYTRNGQLRAGAHDKNWFAENPARLMEVFWESARRATPLSPLTERRITRNLIHFTHEYQTSSIVRRWFLGICNRPLAAGAALRQMAAAGLLGTYLPEFAAISGIVRYEDFHSYPVDEHTLRAIEALAEIPKLGGSVGTFLEKVLEHVRDPYILVLAILFHDLGKAAGEEHVEEGVRLTHAIAQRIGLTQSETERIAFLVRHHMLMTEIAMYRDVDDPATVAQFAQIMKSDERLRDLLLLSYCDLSAVAPGVWTEWKGALLLKLYLKTERALIGRIHADEDTDFWLKPKAREVKARVPRELRDDVEPYLRKLGEAYFLAFSPQHIAWHMDCLAEARKTGLALRSAINHDTGMNEIVICTRDRHGLFSLLAGAFAAQLADVNSAALFTTDDGYVVDCFTVRDAPNNRPLTDAQIASIERVLRAVILEGQDIQRFVEQSRKKLFVLLQPPLPIPTRIGFDNAVSQRHTVVDIETGDRVGLLYDMARAMAASDVDIYFARIVTDAHRVRDAFYVQQHGAKIEDTAAQAKLRQGLLHAIAGTTPAEITGEKS